MIGYKDCLIKGYVLQYYLCFFQFLDENVLLSGYSNKLIFNFLFLYLQYIVLFSYYQRSLIFFILLNINIDYYNG